MSLDLTTSLAAPPHEFAALEHILLGDLRVLLEDDPQEPETRQWLIAVLGLLADMLPCQFAVEEHGGYLEELRREFPEREDEIEALHRQHAELYRGLCDLRDCLADERQSAAIAAGLRVDLRNWMEQYESHQEAEADLLQTAANLDMAIPG